jgi:hypothetical protein
VFSSSGQAAGFNTLGGFESLQDAEHWIATEAQNWLNALNTQL